MWLLAHGICYDISCMSVFLASILKGQANGQKDRKRKRERTKPIDFPDNDECLPSSDMEVCACAHSQGCMGEGDCGKAW